MLKQSLLSLSPSHLRSCVANKADFPHSMRESSFWLLLDPHSTAQGTKLIQGSCMESRMAETAFTETGCSFVLLS